MTNRGLGRGLSALISDQNSYEKESRNAKNINQSRQNLVESLEIEKLIPNKYQPRKTFNEEAIAELADSIKRHGIIQPIVVRKSKENDDKYEIIAGERRVRASKIAGLKIVPVIIKILSDIEVSEQALIENVQRENLNPLEESEAYKELIANYKYNQEEVARAVGKNRSHIANMLRILDMPENVKNFIRDNKLSFGHTKVIAASEYCSDIAEEIVKKGLSVRQTEKLVKTWPKKTANKINTQEHEKNSKQNVNSDLLDISENLSEKLGLEITIDAKGSKGRVNISFNNYEQLDNIIEILSK